MTKKELSTQIVNDLMKNPFFDGYSIRKKDMSIIFKTKEITKSLEFQLSSITDGFFVFPYYFIRYDVLRNWFEKRHSLNSFKDSKKIMSFTFFGKKLDVKNEFRFKEDWSNYDKEFIIMEKVIMSCCEFVFNKLGTLKGCYENLIMPIIQDKSGFQNVGFEWVVDMITLCRIVAPNEYPLFKIMIMSQLQCMFNNGEPNVEMYYDKLDEIFFDLESQDFSKVKID